MVSSFRSSVAKYFQDFAAVDLRGLAFFRILFGILLFLDTLAKYFSAGSFLTDKGVYPLSLYQLESQWWTQSLHAMSGAVEYQILLGLVQGFACLFFIFGYQTKVAQIILWVLLVSLHGRNPLTLHAGDNLIRLLLFWSFFTPLEKRYSLDSLRSTQAPTTNFFSIGTAALLLQILFVYFFTALLKHHAEWTDSFLAIYYAMSLEQFTTPLGQWLTSFPKTLQMVTLVTFGLELLGPLTLIIPRYLKVFRWITPLIFIGFHLGLILTMQLGLFPWTCIIAWILFLPAGVWDLIDKRLSKQKFASATENLSGTEVYLADLPKRWVVRLFVGVCLVSVLTWNVLRLPVVDARAPEFLRGIILPLRLDQHWSMFAPFPMKGDGWFVAEGRLVSGEVLDVWNHSPLSWEKPASVYETFRDVRWRKLMNHIWLSQSSKGRQMEFGKYLCREWDTFAKDSGRALLSYQLYYMREESPNLGERPIIKKIEVWSHRCQ